MNLPRRRALWMLLAAALWWSGVADANAGSYKYIELGDGVAYDINDVGQVVGVAGNPTLWSGGNAISLGTLGGLGSVAYGINNAGQVVGFSAGPNGFGRAVLWNGTTPIKLGPLPGGTDSLASDINDVGQVVGNSTTHAGRGGFRATLWNGTTPTDLGTLGGSESFALGINDVGQVVGTSQLPGSLAPFVATLWNGTTPTNLGTLGGSSSQANDINDVGQVVGTSLIAERIVTHATLWNGTTPIDLGTLPGAIGDSIAYGINNAGQVVGWSGWAGGPQHATLWNGRVATDLNTFLDAATLAAGWSLIDAMDINDSGWIAGTAYNSLTGQGRAYLLVPVPIPEPTISALLLAGLGALGFARHRRKRAASISVGWPLPR